MGNVNKSILALIMVSIFIIVVAQTRFAVLVIADNLLGESELGDFSLALSLNRMVLVAHGIPLSNGVGYGGKNTCQDADDIENLNKNKCEMFMYPRVSIIKKDTSHFLSFMNTTSVEVRTDIFDHYARDIFSGISNHCKFLINDKDILHNDDEGTWKSLCPGRPSGRVNIYITDNANNIVQKISTYW